MVGQLMDDAAPDRVEDAALCVPCGGRCCKTSPGRFSPQDLDRSGGCTLPVIERLLDEGTASIGGALVSAMNSAVAPVLTLAAQGIGRPAIDLFRESARCVHLGVHGCAFTLEDRPFECGAIVPEKSGCSMPGYLRMEDLWAPAQGPLRQAVERRCGHSWLQELDAQLHDQGRRDPFIQGARALVRTRGLAQDDAQIEMIAALARSFPS